MLESRLETLKRDSSFREISFNFPNNMQIVIIMLSW